MSHHSTIVNQNVFLIYCGLPIAVKMALKIPGPSSFLLGIWGGTTMSAKQKTVAALLLVLVAEAQSRVSVNVRLDTPDSGREEIKGHIVGDTFVPGPAAAPASRLLPGLLPSGLYTQASLFARSQGSTDDANIPGELIPRSSPRW